MRRFFSRIAKQSTIFAMPTMQTKPLTLRITRQLRWGCVLLLVSVSAAGCQSFTTTSLKDRLIASNQREWSPEFRTLPFAEIQEDSITLRNIRNSEYVTEKDYLLRYYDRSFALSDINGVDFIMVPFQGLETIAHTMLSFELADGSYIAVSVEVRTEKGESYSTSMGMSNQFEITYVVADERDLIRLRTRHRDADVFVYPSTATPEAAQKLFVDIMQRVNKLHDKPEFYDTLTNNCTTNLVRHINRVFPSRIPFAWPVLLSGHSDKYAYQLGLLDKSYPFEKLKAAAYVNDLAEKNYDDPNFSQIIRSRRAALERVGKISGGDSTAAASAALDSKSNRPSFWSLISTRNRRGGAER